VRNRFRCRDQCGRRQRAGKYQEITTDIRDQMSPAAAEAAELALCKPWDIAAGIVLVREAGGTVTDALGSQHTFRATSTVATSPQLLGQILDLMGRANANAV
jgi:hypothetical protein